MHYWADLQSVHGFRCYNNTSPNAKCQRVLVLARCLCQFIHMVTVLSKTSDDITLWYQQLSVRQSYEDSHTAFSFPLATLVCRLTSFLIENNRVLWQAFFTEFHEILSHFYSYLDVTGPKPHLIYLSVWLKMRHVRNSLWRAHQRKSCYYRYPTNCTIFGTRWLSNYILVTVIYFVPVHLSYSIT